MDGVCQWLEETLNARPFPFGANLVRAEPLMRYTYQWLLDAYKSRSLTTKAENYCYLMLQSFV